MKGNRRRLQKSSMRHHSGLSVLAASSDGITDVSNGIRNLRFSEDMGSLALATSKNVTAPASMRNRLGVPALGLANASRMPKRRGDCSILMDLDRNSSSLAGKTRAAQKTRMHDDPKTLQQGQARRQTTALEQVHHKWTTSLEKDRPVRNISAHKSNGDGLMDFVSQDRASKPKPLVRQPTKSMLEGTGSIDYSFPLPRAPNVNQKTNPIITRRRAMLMRKGRTRRIRHCTMATSVLQVEAKSSSTTRHSLWFPQRKTTQTHHRPQQQRYDSLLFAAVATGKPDDVCVPHRKSARPAPRSRVASVAAAPSSPYSTDPVEPMPNVVPSKPFCISSKRMVMLSPVIDSKRRDTKKTPSSKIMSVVLPESFVVHVNNDFMQLDEADDAASSLSDESTSPWAIDFEPDTKRNSTVEVPTADLESEAKVDGELQGRPFADGLAPVAAQRVVDLTLSPPLIQRDCCGVGIDNSDPILPTRQAPDDEEDGFGGAHDSAVALEADEAFPVDDDILPLPLFANDGNDEVISISSDAASHGLGQHPVRDSSGETRPAQASTRRPRRSRKVTDRFTITAHVAGGRYLPGPIEPYSKRFQPKIEPDDTKSNVDNRTAGCSSVVFDDEDAQSNDDASGCETTSSSERNEHPIAQFQSATSQKKQDRDTAQSRRRPGRPRRNRKQPDFYHKGAAKGKDYDSCNVSGSESSILSRALPDEPPAAVDCNRNSPCDAEVLPDAKPRRTRTQTDFYHVGIAQDDNSDDSCAESGAENNIETDHLVEESKGAESSPFHSAVPVENKPRRLRKFKRNPVLPKKTANTGEANGWSVDQMVQLKMAHRRVDPTSSTFWFDVATLVDGKTAEECRYQWFSATSTPALKQAKQSAAVEDYDGDDDDIFDLTPMRGSLLNGFSAISKAAVALPFKLGETPAKPLETSAMERPFRPKPLYKSYLQRMKRDATRADNKAKGPKAAPKAWNKMNRGIAEDVYDHDMDIKVRLTPGGTLKVRAQVDDEDNFWSDMSDSDE